MYGGNYAGQRFGRLTAIKSVGVRKGKWQARCDCGAVVIVGASRLRSGHVRSCGCLRPDELGNRRRKHGESHGPSRLYRIWASIRCRTRNMNNPYYGGRGIKVCPEWDDFLAFRAWALSHGYRSVLSIDRKDNDQGYSPGNCRWATAKQQANNRGKRGSRTMGVLAAAETINA
jgi:hypothetical protein